MKKNSPRNRYNNPYQKRIELFYSPLEQLKRGGNGKKKKKKILSEERYAGIFRHTFGDSRGSLVTMFRPVADDGVAAGNQAEKRREKKKGEHEGKFGQCTLRAK